MRLQTCCLTLLFLTSAATAADKAAFPPTPEAFSSFGAAVSDGHVYVYGGHIGKTHSYSTEAVTGKFRRLNLANPKAWEELPAGPGLQGLALVAHGGKLYRIGGMQPRNRPGESADNHSVASCAVYDPRTGKWESLPDMPAGRSSHDATVAGDTIVVVGGWNMTGSSSGASWHTATLVLDLSKKPLRWESIAQPFERRALNVAALNGKVFVVGGMSSENEIEKTVDVLDLKTRRWSKGPILPGVLRNGFTPAVCLCGDKVYASPSDGKVYRLNDKHDAWSEVAVLQTKRLVHRIVPMGTEALLALGGSGKGANVAQVESVEPACCDKEIMSRAPTAAPGQQAFCPVMTSIPIDEEAREVEYRGVKIKICCSACVKKWNTDPEAYLNPALLPQLKGMDLPARKIAQVYCPIYTDRVVSPTGPSAEFKGVTVYFFNESAKRRFLAEPEQFVNVTVLPQLKNR